MLTKIFHICLNWFIKLPNNAVALICKEISYIFNMGLFKLLNDSDLSLAPRKNIIRLEEGSWEVLAEDPQIDIKIRGLTLFSGWYQVEIWCDPNDDLDLKLYYKCTNTFENELRSVSIGCVYESYSIRYIYLPAFFRTLRLDPCDTGHQISLLRLNLMPIRKSNAVARLTRDHGLSLEAANGQLEYAKTTRVSTTTSYAQWIRANPSATGHAYAIGEKAKRSMASDYTRFSIIVPVYRSRIDWLDEALESARNQTSTNFEIVVIDDGSRSDEISRYLEGFSATERRSIVLVNEKNLGIGGAINRGLDACSGEWFVVLDHDDLLVEDAIRILDEGIDTNPDASLIYSDHDHIDEMGNFSNPYFKPDWNYELFLGQNYISHLSCYRTDYAQQINGYDEKLNGSQDWDFSFRYIEHFGCDANVVHIQKILYHWRIDGSTFSKKFQEKTSVAARKAIEMHLERTGRSSRIDREVGPSWFSLKNSIVGDEPSVTIIIPTRDNYRILRNCISSVLKETRYQNYNILIANNQSVEQEALEYLHSIKEHTNIRVFQADYTFNFSRICNEAVSLVDDPYIVLLNDDTEVQSGDWLHQLIAHAQRPDVGVVGAKLVYPDNTVQHGGVILGIQGVAGHAHRHFPPGSSGYFGRLILDQELSATTGACLASRKSIFTSLGGLNERDLAVAFNDIDYCLRVRKAGYKVIWSARTTLLHYESKSRGSDATAENFSRFKEEVRYMKRTWGDKLLTDPAYSPWLSLRREDFSLR